jgi:Ca2+-binding RTX toxin-like protein
MPTFTGTAGSDTLTGTVDADTLISNGGSDTTLSTGSLFANPSGAGLCHVITL